MTPWIAVGSRNSASAGSASPRNCVKSRRSTSNTSGVNDGERRADPAARGEHRVRGAPRLLPSVARAEALRHVVQALVRGGDAESGALAGLREFRERRLHFGPDDDDDIREPGAARVV